jgi:hypothetical protein
MAFRALPLFLFHGTEARVVSLPRNGSERNSERLLLFLMHRTEFRVFSLLRQGSERNSERLLLFFDPRNGIPTCFLFRGRVRNGIPRVYVPRNSRNSVGSNHYFRLFRLPRNYFFVGNSQPYSNLRGPEAGRD